MTDTLDKRPVPRAVRQQLDRADQLIGQGLPSDGLALCDSVLAEDPDNIMGLYVRSKALTALDRPVEALATIDRARALYPGAGTFHYTAGSLAARLGDRAGADRRLERAVAASPQDLTYWRAWCQQVIAGGDAARIAGVADRIVERLTDRADAWSLRAACLHAIDRLAEALDAVDTALALEADRAAFLSDRGALLLALGRPAQAVAAFERARAAAPGDAGIGSNLGLALMRADRPGEAETVLGAVLDEAPDHADALYNLGLLRAAGSAGAERADRAAQAAELLERSLAARLFPVMDRLIAQAAGKVLPPRYLFEADLDVREVKFLTDRRDHLFTQERPAPAAPRPRRAVTPGPRCLLINDTARMGGFGHVLSALGLRRLLEDRGATVIALAPDVVASVTAADALLAGQDSPGRFRAAHASLARVIGQADRVVVNGMQAILGRQDYSLKLLALARVSAAFGVPTAIVNHSVYPEPAATLTDAGVMDLYRTVYTDLAAACTIDSLSTALLGQLGVAAEMAFDAAPVAARVLCPEPPTKRARRVLLGLEEAGSVADLAPLAEALLAQDVQLLGLAPVAGPIAAGGDVLPHEPLSGPADWLGQIAGAAAVLTGSVQTTAAAMAMGTPIVPIAAPIPAAEVMVRDLGGPAAIRAGTGDAGAPDGLVTAILAAVEHGPQEAGQRRATLDGLIARAEKNVAGLALAAEAAG